MSYDDVYNVIAKYAPEMLQYYADKWSRFPRGGNAAMIVNYLNDRCMWWHDHDKDTALIIADAAAEIISRCE